MESKKITKDQIKAIAEKYGYTYADTYAVMMVEGSGSGFDSNTGKILIQFEPAWYRRLDAKDGFSGSGVWEQNKVEKQSAEWVAFNDAFAKDADAAMEATSWGCMQVMGFHWKDLGFDSIGEMVDFAKESEANQVELGMKFIHKSKKLNTALLNHDWASFAYSYNGSNYKVNNYDVKLKKFYEEGIKNQ